MFINSYIRFLYKFIIIVSGDQMKEKEEGDGPQSSYIFPKLDFWTVLLLVLFVLFIAILIFWYKFELVVIWATLLVAISLIVFAKRGREDYEIVNFQFKKEDMTNGEHGGKENLIFRVVKAIVSIIVFFVFPLLFPFIVIFSGSSGKSERLFDESVKTNIIINLLLSCIFLLIIYLIGKMYFVFAMAFVALLAIILHFKFHYDSGMIMRVITALLSIILLLLAVFVYIILSVWFVLR